VFSFSITLAMASFLHCTDLGSDTDDEDYNPEEDEKKAKDLSEEEDNGGEKEPAKKRRQKKATKGFLQPEIDQNEAEEEKRRKEEFRLEEEERKTAAEKAKVDDLWAGECTMQYYVYFKWKSILPVDRGRPLPGPRQVAVAEANAQQHSLP